MSAALEDALYQRALATATPATLPLVKRSAYLADALRSMQTDTQNIRTPGALAANLLADAVLKYGSDKADKKLLGAQTEDQASLMALHSLPGNVPPPPAGAPPAPTPAADARSSSPAGLADALQADTPPTQAGLSPYERIGIASGPQDLLPLAQAVYGEARGEGSHGQQATGSVILNRSLKSGQSLADVVAAPHQFEGYNAKAKALGLDSPQLSPILANLHGLLSGETPDPTGGATNFYSPGAQAALGRPKPAWDNGQGQQIDHQMFFGGQPGSNVPLPPGPVSPMQVATNGPLPQMGAPPPQPPQGGPAPSPGVMQPPPPNPAPGGMAQPGGPGPAAPPPQAAPGSVPTGPGPTPQEIADYQRYAADPRTLPLAMQIADKVRERMRTPMDAPKNMQWSAQAGRYVPMPGTETTQLPGASPSDAAQRDPFGAVSHASIPGVQGSVPEGMIYQNGQYIRVQQPNAWSAPHPVAGAEGQYQTNSVTGEVRKATDAPFTAKDLGGVIGDLTKSPQYEKASHATDMYRAAVNAAGRPGGMTDAELIDFAAQELSGGVARQFNQKMIENSQGPIARLKQYIPEIISGQRLSPEARAALLTTMRDYATEAQGTFRSLAQSKNAYTQGLGVSLDPYVAPLMRDLPDAPTAASIPNGMPGVQPGGGNSSSPGAGGPGGSNPAARLSPQQAQALPPGTRFVGQDGVARVRH